MDKHELQKQLDQEWKRIIKQIHLHRETGRRYDMTIDKSKEIKALNLYRDATQALNGLGQMVQDARLVLAYENLKLLKEIK